MGGGSIGADAVFDGDTAGFIASQGRVNHALLCAHMAVDDGQVFLGDGAGFPDFPEFARDPGIFGKQDHAARFPIKTVHQVRRGGIFQINPRAADEAGVFIALGGMANEAGGFVDNQQVVVFVDDFK